MFFYESIITLGLEIDLFWKQRITGDTVLFFLNKYITLACHIFGILSFILTNVSDYVSTFGKLDLSGALINFRCCIDVRCD